MAYPSDFLHPLRAVDALRDQLGSVRSVYLAGDRTEKRGDIGHHNETVLLLHGFFQTRNIWEVMEDRLRHDGYGVMSFDLGGLFWRYNTRSLDHLAAMIREKIEALAQREGFQALHIVGHSKGGLLARRYIQHFGGDKRTKSLITLGTPHHGTPTALLGMALTPVTRNPFELMHRSRLVQSLNTDSFPPHIPFTSIYSRHDIVCPYWCSILRPEPGDSSMHNVQVKGVGHSELTWDAGVYRVVQDRLAHATDLWRERRSHLLQAEVG